MNDLLQSHNHCVAYCSTVWSSHRGSRSGAQQQCDVSGAAAATEHSTATVFTTNQRLLHSKHSGIADTATVRCYPTIKSRIIVVRRAITTLRYTAELHVSWLSNCFMIIMWIFAKHNSNWSVRCACTCMWCKPCAGLAKYIFTCTCMRMGSSDCIQL